MKISAALLIACCLVFAALFIASFGGSNSSRPTVQEAAVETPTTETPIDAPPIRDLMEEPITPVSGVDESSESPDIQALVEAANRRELTNAEALQRRNAIFGRVMSRDPYTYVPTIKVAPEFPPEALQLEMSGFVLMEYTVAADGTIGPIAVLNASSPIFEIAAIRSVGRYRYAPRIERGQFVDTDGVKTLIVYGEPENAPSVEETTDRIFVQAPDTE